MGPLPLRRKALALLYYLALEGPSRRERLADLLWGHGAALQNLRAELAHLRGFLGREALWGRVLELPPGVELDRSAGVGEPLEGLEGLSPAWDDWLQLKRLQLVANALPPLPERLKEVRPPALVVLIGPPGSGREALARALAQRLGLPFREALGPGQGVFYLADPLPGKEEGLRETPAPGRVLVLARSLFGEDPGLLLALRARFPAESTFVLQVPRLSWEEAKERFLAHLPFREAARYYLASGGRPGILRELLAMGSPEALPQRVRAKVALEARYLPLEARRALEVLALHPGPFPPSLAGALGVAGALGELEHRGWLCLREKRYGWCEPALRRYLAEALALGERLHLHRRMAEHFLSLGDEVASLYHWVKAGEALQAHALLGQLKGWRRLVGDPAFPWKDHPPPQATLGLGRRVSLDLPEELLLVSWDGEVAEVSFAVEEPLILSLEGEVWQELPLGLGLQQEHFPLRLAGANREVYFLPVRGPSSFFWGTVLPDAPLAYRFALPPGVYRLSLGTRGLARLRVGANRITQGDTPILVSMGALVEV
ncbi:hypothetical protein [Thermus sp. LT1-2-5]|uniref:hypothetical protein n=1 Tax=Thermus sp. LT1-2-5 TaxID=3026935 RepID=UPI0033659A12